jgi:hypothetical protein
MIVEFNQWRKINDWPLKHKVTKIHKNYLITSYFSVILCFSAFVAKDQIKYRTKKY